MFHNGDRLVSRLNGAEVTFFRDFGRTTFASMDGMIYFNEDFYRAKPAIVAVIEDGKPRPSSRPFIHSNRELAEIEARRLGGLHPGNEFAVYELVSTSSAPKPAATTRAA